MQLLSNCRSWRVINGSSVAAVDLESDPGPDSYLVTELFHFQLHHQLQDWLVMGLTVKPKPHNVSPILSFNLYTRLSGAVRGLPFNVRIDESAWKKAVKQHARELLRNYSVWIYKCPVNAIGNHKMMRHLIQANTSKQNRKNVDARVTLYRPLHNNL